MKINNFTVANLALVGLLLSSCSEPQNKPAEQRARAKIQAIINAPSQPVEQPKAGVDVAIQEALRQASNKINGGLPMMVDKETRLESTVPGPGKKWTYLYTITSATSSDISQIELQDALAVVIRNGVCTSEDMAVFVKNGVQIIYRYRGSDGGIIGDIVVNPQDCP